jgi:hypothetical protein
MNDKKDLRRRLQEFIPKSEAQRRITEQLRSDLAELKAELAAKRENEGPPPWPGALEPLVLAAAFLVPNGDIDSIAGKVIELSSKPYQLPAIRSTVLRLVQRELLAEGDRSFTVTPQGERELFQARDDAKRWIDALGNGR